MEHSLASRVCQRRVIQVRRLHDKQVILAVRKIQEIPDLVVFNDFGDDDCVGG